MAIIDSHCILFEGPLSAESTGKAVPLTALRLPGRAGPLRHIHVTHKKPGSHIWNCKC